MSLLSQPPLYHVIIPIVSIPDIFYHSLHRTSFINTLRPRQNCRHFADIFKCIFLNENVRILLRISLKFVPKLRSNQHYSSTVQIMAWRRPDAKPLCEPMMVNLLTHICVSRPQWVKRDKLNQFRIWMNNHIHIKLWDVISHPRHMLAIKVWLSNYIAQETMGVITYTCLAVFSHTPCRQTRLSVTLTRFAKLFFSIAHSIGQHTQVRHQ